MADRIIGTARIRYVGDASQLDRTASTLGKAVGTSFDQAGRNIAPINAAIAKSFAKIYPEINKLGGASKTISALRVQMDTLNNSLKATAQLAVRVGSTAPRLPAQFYDREGNLLRDDASRAALRQYASRGLQAQPIMQNFAEVQTRVANLDGYLRIQGKINDVIAEQRPKIQAATDVWRQYSRGLADAVQQSNNLVERRRYLQGALGRLDSEIASTQARIQASPIERFRARYPNAPTEGMGTTGAPVTGDYLSQQSRLAALQERRASVEREIVNLTNQEAGAVSRVATAQELTNQASARRVALIRGQAAQVSPLLDARGNALEVAPEPLANLSALRQLSPQLFKKLQAEGLPLDPEQQLLRQLNISPITKDLVRGTNRLSGEFIGLNNKLVQFSAEVTDSGKIVTRFGGQLRGMGQFLSQTTRDLQKVVEWTVATTVVFGALAGIRSAIESFKELDTVLTRFAITANLSKAEALGFFNTLANVAEVTATPIQELTKSADDIALATRKTGQSVGEWQRQIEGLATAVGVFTNLTGQDTEQATDVLVSTMKQLNLQGTELTTVLNKITAVAGGQAGAISDVAQGLSVMAESAKTANLNLDETIATIQTLSQVTSKSPAEVATSFKNLVGALDNPIAKKSLAQYNIALKDASGDLRNILDVYGEIAEKIRLGVIPESDVKELIRGIAGGPRRAPDAAALLGAIDEIRKVTTLSSGASNEALIANAKAVDTIQASIVRLQNSVQVSLFQKFGDEVRGSIDTVIGILENLSEVIKSVPEGLIGLGVQFAAMFLALRGGVAITRLFAGTMLELGGAITGAGIAMQGFYANLRGGEAQMAFARRQAQDQIAMFVDPLALEAQKNYARKNLAKAGLLLAGGAALGGAIGAAGQGEDFNPASLIGPALQGAGTAAFLAPVPGARALGVALLGVGTLVDALIPKTKKLADENRNLTEEQLAATQSIKEAQLTYSELSKTNSELEKGISAAQRSIAQLEEGSKEYNSALAGLQENQRQYVRNAMEMVGANSQIWESLKKLAGTNYANLITGSGPAGLAAAQEDLVKKLLRQVYGESFEPLQNLERGFSALQLPTSGLLAGGTSSITAPTSGVNRVTGQLNTVTVALEDIRKGGDALKALFANDIFKIEPKTKEELAAIQEGINNLRENSPDLADKMQVAFDNMAASVDVVTASLYNMQSAMAFLEAGSLIAPFRFDPEQSQKAMRFIQQMQAQAQAISLNPEFQRPTYLVGGPPGQTRADVLVGNINKVLEPIYGILGKGGAPTDFALMAAIIQGGREIASTWDIGGDSVEALIDDLAVASGLPPIFDKQRVSLEQFAEEAEDLRIELTGITDNYLANIASKSLDLEVGRRQGDFAENPEYYAAQSGQIEALKDNYLDLINIRDLLVSQAEGVGAAALDEAKSMVVLSAGLSDVIGLENAQILSVGGLFEAMLGLVDGYNLSGAAADEWLKKVIAVQSAIITLSKVLANNDLVATFRVALEKGGIAGAIKALKALRNLQGPGGILARTGETQTDVGDIDAAIAALQEVAGYIGGGGYTPTPGPSIRSPGSGGSKAKGPDVSTLDIPEIIANAANRDALLQEAIRRARSLQSTIPGATKEARNDIVELLDGTKNILEVTGIKSDLLRKALQELADIEKKRLEMETKADTIRRIRVGSGSFAAFANVPLNSQTGVSVGSPQGPIAININVNGQVLTPAQMAELANMIGAALKNQIANGG